MNKQNIPLIIGLSIPIVMTIFIAASIYLPRLGSVTQYDFIYAIGEYPTYVENVDGGNNIRHDYQVRNQQVTVSTSELIDNRDRPPYQSNRQSPRFFRYNTASGTNQELSFEEVRAMTINDSVESPDGFIVDYAYGVDNVMAFLFGGRAHDQGATYLTSENSSHEIKLHTTAYSGRYNRGYHFVGWIVE